MISLQIILLWEYWNEYEGKTSELNHQEQEQVLSFYWFIRYSLSDKKCLRWNIYNLGVEVACGFVFDVVIVIDDQGWVLSLQSS